MFFTFGEPPESPLETEVSMNFIKTTWAAPTGRARNRHEQRRGASIWRRSSGGGPISWEVLKPIAIYVGLVSLLSVGSLGAL